MATARQPFIGSGKYVARKKFVYDGESFKAGDVFPSQDLKVAPRRLRQMIEARMVEELAGERPSSKKG